MPYYISQWEWDESSYAPYWRSPAGTIGAIDLRNLSECSAFGGTPDSRAKGFFTTERIDPNLELYLGDDLSSKVARSLRRSTEKVLGISPGSVTATTVIGVLAQVLTELGDPTGVDAWRPLMSDCIHLPGHDHVWRGDWRSNPAWRDCWLRTKQCDYRAARNEALCGILPENHHQKMLDYWSKRYGVDYHDLIPSDLPDEPPVLHATIVGDTFDTASDTGLGAHTATGPNGGFSWTVINGSGTVRAATNDLDTGTAGGENNFRAEGPLSGDDHYAEVYLTFPAGSSRDGRVYSRFSPTTWDGYLLLAGGGPGDTLLLKVIGGSGTLLNDYNDALGAPTNRQYRLESDGNTHTPTVGGVVLAAQTDTQLTGQVRGGCGAYSNVTTIDNFQAEDIMAASGRIMGRLAGHGGLAGIGGIAGKGGGLAG